MSGIHCFLIDVVSSGEFSNSGARMIAFRRSFKTEGFIEYLAKTPGLFKQASSVLAVSDKLKFHERYDGDEVYDLEIRPSVGILDWTEGVFIRALIPDVYPSAHAVMDEVAAALDVFVGEPSINFVAVPEDETMLSKLKRFVAESEALMLGAGRDLSPASHRFGL